MITNSLLTEIRDLFDACGPQSLKDTHQAVLGQGFRINLDVLRTHLEYLQKLKVIISVWYPELEETVYGYPGEF